LLLFVPEFLASHFGPKDNRSNRSRQIRPIRFFVHLMPENYSIKIPMISTQRNTYTKQAKQDSERNTLGGFHSTQAF